MKSWEKAVQEITIRHSNVNDAAAIKAIYDGKEASAGTLQHPYTSLKTWQSRLENNPDSFFSLVAEQGGEIVGQAGLSIFANPRRKHAGQFGLAVRDDCHGRGIGTKLLAALIDIADNWANLVRLELFVFTDNKAAIHLYEKHGFKIEGESPAYAFRNGQYDDVYHMARVRKP